MANALFCLNQTNALQLDRYATEKQNLFKGTLWHKFIIHNASKLSREVILKVVLEAVYPCDLIPVLFKKEGPDATFLARNCGSAVEKLCKQSLLINMPSPTGSRLVLSVLVAYLTVNQLQINVQDNIFDTIKRRLKNSVLNLDSFHLDTTLSDKIYCVLSQPKILFFVLHLAKALPFSGVRLWKNSIRSLASFDALASTKGLEMVDLRSNLIENIDELKYLSKFPIKDIFLEGNPLCNTYPNKYEFYKAIKKFCSKVEQVDGVHVGSGGLFSPRRNYLVDPKGKELIGQFLEHFFPIFDSEERVILKDIYQSDSKFSLTCSFLNGQKSSSTAKLETYMAMSRNILRISDYSKITKTLFCGSDRITEAFKRFPATIHDPCSFCVDTSLYTRNSAVVTVSGVFKETRVPAKLFSFMRTFVLLGDNTGEYKILNDQMHITNVTTAHSIKAFSEKSPGITCCLATLQRASSPEQKKEMLYSFSKITTVNLKWSEKYLEVAMWDLKMALIQFIDLYKLNHVPSEAFDK